MLKILSDAQLLRWTEVHCLVIERALSGTDLDELQRWTTAVSNWPETQGYSDVRTYLHAL